MWQTRLFPRSRAFSGQREARGGSREESFVLAVHGVQKGVPVCAGDLRSSSVSGEDELKDKAVGVATEVHRGAAPEEAGEAPRGPSRHLVCC